MLVSQEMDKHSVRPGRSASMTRGIPVNIDTYQIMFPFEPYDIQKNIMQCIIQCLKSNRNGLIESPTGTGKTLSLLCSSLAWLQKEKQMFRTMSQSQLSLKNANKSHSTSKASFLPPKIIYASRTHSQLSQAILELRRSQYRDIKTVVLGSRDLLCIHPEVQRIATSGGKNTACREKINSQSSQSCAFHSNMQGKKESFGINYVVDIEDIVWKGNRDKFCPFYVTRELAKEADLVFMPYNYILDPKVRSNYGIDVRNSVIILDEGHNIPKLCEDGVSFEIKSSGLGQLLNELTKGLMEFKKAMEQGDVSGQFKELLSGILRLKQNFLNLEAGLQKIDIKSGGSLMGMDIYIKILTSAGFTSETLPFLSGDLESLSTFLHSNNTDSTGVDNFSSILSVLATIMQQKKFTDSYKVYVQLESKTDNAQPGKVFNFWCLNPAVGLAFLNRFGPRSIILASGTLKPMDFLQEELDLPTPLTLSNPHIIQPHQLFVGVFRKGPKHCQPLLSTFGNRDSQTYLEDLGESILKIAQVVPAGLLVFFPSYSFMDTCVNSWMNIDIFSRIQLYKKVFVEPRNSESFKQVLDNYYKAVREGGGCLMAVCRGKVSEGLDFADDYGRAVVLTGIPYSPAQDPKVMAKKSYLDGRIKTQQNLSVNGSAWYRLEACRALNQAIGRIIRHVNDYGAIIFCDKRCDEAQITKEMPTWVSSRLKSYETFSAGHLELTEFFETSLKVLQKKTQQQKALQQKTQHQKTQQQKTHQQKTATPPVYKETSKSSYSIFSYYPEPTEEDLMGYSNSSCIPQNPTSVFEGLKLSESRQLQSDLKNNVLSPTSGQKRPPGDTPLQRPGRRIRVVPSMSSAFHPIEVQNKIKAEAGIGNISKMTTTEYLQWVKNVLKGEDYSQYMTAMEKFRVDRNVKQLALAVKASFKIQSFLPKCILGNFTKGC